MPVWNLDYYLWYKATATGKWCQWRIIEENILSISYSCNKQDVMWRVFEGCRQWMCISGPHDVTLLRCSLFCRNICIAVRLWILYIIRTGAPYGQRFWIRLWLSLQVMKNVSLFVTLLKHFKHLSMLGFLAPNILVLFARGEAAIQKS